MADFKSESVAGFKSESVAEFIRNRWPTSVGISTLRLAFRIYRLPPREVVVYGGGTMPGTARGCGDRWGKCLPLSLVQLAPRDMQDGETVGLDSKKIKRAQERYRFVDERGWFRSAV